MKKTEQAFRHLWNCKFHRLNHFFYCSDITSRNLPPLKGCDPKNPPTCTLTPSWETGGGGAVSAAALPGPQRHGAQGIREE